MPTAPTRVSYNTPASGNYSTDPASFTTASFAVQVGDLVVVLASRAAASVTTSVTPSMSGGSVTWTNRVATPSFGTNDTTRSSAYCWTGAVGAAGSFTCTLSRPASGGSVPWGMSATVWRSHGGVGTTFNGNNGTGSGAPSQAGAASCAANSAVQCVVNDWNAVDGTTRTWRTINGAAQSEALYFRDAAQHTVYGGYTLDTGAAGSITQGLTTPSTMRWALAGIEILGAGAATAAPPLQNPVQRLLPILAR